jgi:hypothetical protein
MLTNGQQSSLASYLRSVILGLRRLKCRSREFYKTNNAVALVHGEVLLTCDGAHFAGLDFVMKSIQSIFDSMDKLQSSESLLKERSSISHVTSLPVVFCILSETPRCNIPRLLLDITVDLRSENFAIFFQRGLQS